MIRALLSVRFRALLASLTNQGRMKKKRSVGVLVLFAFAYLYLGVFMIGSMAMTFYTLAGPYHAAGLDWLYFAMSALMALGFSVFFNVFATQSQLYEARDNTLLLSMPIPPRLILSSRLVPLLLMGLLEAGIVMLPAMVVYGIVVKWSFAMVAGQLLGLVSIVALSQAISCLLGWLLHLLLSRMNKSAASLLYMVVFLAAYFYIYSQASTIMNAMVISGDRIAGILSWIWPLYALGKGSDGQLLYTLGSLLLCCACFALAWIILSRTFLKTATAQGVSRKRGKLNLAGTSASSPKNAIAGKELRKFLSSPVYLTNAGIGILMALVLTVAGVLFRGDMLEMLAMMPELDPLKPLLVCVFVAFLGSTVYISCPSVSLEGKNLWILKSLPIPSRDILCAKLAFHNRMTIPVLSLAALVLSVTYSCCLADIALCTLFAALIALTSGLLGMNAGLHWARLDYISEAYPVKQSLGAGVTMFGMMGLPLALGLLYFFVLPTFSPTLFLLLSCSLLGAICFGLYRLMVTWGVRKWESLN